MSLFFPVHRPSTGLSFTERGIALVELRRGWDRPGIVRINERTLPEGVLALSASEPNVKDQDALAKELRVLVTTSSERTLAVCLPDRVCHLALAVSA
jgi:Tfp pilus assembly PilM family ATPase